MIEQKVMIISADGWNFVDSNTGEARRGTTVWYCNVENLNKKINSKDLSSGTQPLKVTVPIDVSLAVKESGGAPCAAIAHCVIDQDKDGMNLVPKDFTVIKEK